jgi:uncharacterized protein (TIGR03118 family)
MPFAMNAFNLRLLTAGNRLVTSIGFSHAEILRTFMNLGLRSFCGITVSLNQIRTSHLKGEFVNQHHLGKKLIAPAVGLLALFLGAQALPGQNVFREVDLVSDIPGRALNTDPNLKNPWGIASSATSPFWIANNGTGTATLYNTAGTPQALVVTIPDGAGGNAAVTGQVFNAGSAFNSDRFIFASEDGLISGWRSGTVAETLYTTPNGAIYKGLAIGSIGTNAYLYATDFHNGKIDVLGSTGAPSLTGHFVDPTLPVGFAPFNIQTIGNQVYVTYAKQDADAEDDVAGAGNGYVDVFDLNGNFIKRLISGGVLNSPWGLAVAPSSFGAFAGDLLVGNFGNGMIDAFNLASGAFVDSLRDASGNPIVIRGLWALDFGNGGAGGDPGSLYFTAGINREADGLFGSITPVPEPGTGVAGIALVGFCAAVWVRRRKKNEVTVVALV